MKCGLWLKYFNMPSSWYTFWSVEYETAGNGTTQQYKGKCESFGRLVVHSSVATALVAKAWGRGFNSLATTKIFFIFF